MRLSAQSDDAVMRARAWKVHQALWTYYGAPTLKERRDPLSELMLTILSQNTSDLNSGRAYAALRQRYPSWEAVLAAPAEGVSEAIRPGGLANVKAPRMQRILADLARERGGLSLDFLAELPVAEAREYLLSLNGVGPKTAACVLLFSLHMPAMPVDTHVHRVALRVGLVPLKTSAEQAHTALEALLPQEAYYPFHLLMIQHGRTLCKAPAPQCGACPLALLCDYARRGQERAEPDA
jgi:endonuclease III